MQFISFGAGAMLASLAFAHPLLSRQYYNSSSAASSSLNSSSISNSSSTSSSSSSISSSSSSSNDIDVIILQFALTLEHLENVFYKEALQKFSQLDFLLAGFDSDFFFDLEEIVVDEQSHVELLTAAIVATGNEPVEACEYNFGFSDVQSFVALSAVLESIGTSAYLGGAPLISSKDILTVAAAITSVEAGHTAQQRQAINEIPVPNPLGTPLDQNSVITLAASFIVSCPSTNFQLPFQAFPTLSLQSSSCTNEESSSSGQSQSSKKSSSKQSSNSKSSSKRQSSCDAPSAGSTMHMQSSASISSGAFVTFVSGLTIVSVELEIVEEIIIVVIPPSIEGQVYAFITDIDVKGTFVDSAVLAGPAVMEIAPAAAVIDGTL